MGVGLFVGAKGNLSGLSLVFGVLSSLETGGQIISLLRLLLAH